MYIRFLCSSPRGHTYFVHKTNAGAKRPGRISLEGAKGGRAPGLYMGNCSAHNNPGTYRKWVFFGRRLAHGWTLRGKISAGGGWGAAAAAPLLRAGFGQQTDQAARSVDVSGWGSAGPDDASLPDRTRGQNTIGAGAPKDPGPKIAV